MINVPNVDPAILITVSPPGPSGANKRRVLMEKRGWTWCVMEDPRRRMADRSGGGGLARKMNFDEIEAT